MDYRNIVTPQSQEIDMGSNSNEEADHVVTIWEVNKSRLSSMHQKLSEPPTILSLAAGRSSCSIFRVPESLIEINGRSYQPHIVSIGPYHHGQRRLQMIQQYKWRYLGLLLSRTKTPTLEDYLKAIEPLESRARECYSEIIPFGKDEFVEMMVLDGCFIIELFRKVGKLVTPEPDDPLFTMAWVSAFFLRDLLCLENQIPFFILERLFELTETSDEGEDRRSLSSLALEFFNMSLQRPDEQIEKHTNLVGKHLLDLLRSSFIPGDQLYESGTDNSPSHIIHCVTKLRSAGIKFKSTKAESFLLVKFRRGVIEMPTVTIDDFMVSFFLNSVAYEQCHKNCPKHITTYATFLDCLLNTSKDVEILCERNIIENYFGTDAEVARFVNKIGKDVTFDINYCYLSKLFSEVHAYYKNDLHVQCASLRYTYFDTPWSFISAMAAFVLLLLTLAQTFFTIYAYLYPR